MQPGILWGSYSNIHPHRASTATTRWRLAVILLTLACDKTCTPPHSAPLHHSPLATEVSFIRIAEQYGSTVTRWSEVARVGLFSSPCSHISIPRGPFFSLSGRLLSESDMRAEKLSGRAPSPPLPRPVPYPASLSTVRIFSPQRGLFLTHRTGKNSNGCWSYRTLGLKKHCTERDGNYNKTLQKQSAEHLWPPPESNNTTMSPGCSAGASRGACACQRDQRVLTEYFSAQDSAPKLSAG